jgi:adenylate kinase
MELSYRDYVVINLKLSREKSFERMVRRAQIEARKDDTPEVMNRRIDLFEKNTIPVLDFFEQQGKLITVNADDTAENVLKEIKSKLEL